MTITRDDVLATLNEVIAEYGEDHVYEPPDEANPDACKYVWDGQPSCIVGHVLNRRGVPLGFFDNHEGQDPLGFNKLIDLNRDAALLLADVQSRQDDKFPWGESLRYALDYEAVRADDSNS